MHLKAGTFDELFRHVISDLLAQEESVVATRGAFVEQVGAFLELANPRARVSRSEIKGTIFSCLGEVLWYLRGDNRIDTIRYYIRDYPGSDSIDGGGLRSSLLRYARNQPDRGGDPTSHKEADVASSGDTSLQCGGHVISWRRSLHMPPAVLYSRQRHRSHGYDAEQRCDARTSARCFCVHISPGIYRCKARRRCRPLSTLGWKPPSLRQAPRCSTVPLDEGYLSTQEVWMPAMPHDGLQSEVERLLTVEEQIRSHGPECVKVDSATPYWRDIAWMLVAFAQNKNGDVHALEETTSHIHHRFYKVYLQKRLTALRNRAIGQRGNQES